jgi:hypothetical protein
MSEKTPLQWSQLQQPFSTLNKFNVVIITSIFFVIRSLQQTIRTSSNLTLMNASHPPDNYPTPFPYFPTRITPGQSPTQRLCPTSRRMHSYDTIHLHFLTMRFPQYSPPISHGNNKNTFDTIFGPVRPPNYPGTPVNSSTHSQIFIQQFHPSVLDIKQHKKPKTTVPISYNEARDRRSKSLLRDRIVESFVAPFNTSDYRFP